MKTAKHFLGRKNELEQLSSFIDEDASGFVYLRGRRRIGKSWLLKEIQKQKKNCFYFSGEPSSTNATTMLNFAKAWGDFSKHPYLKNLSPHSLTWQSLLSEITNYAKNKSSTVTIILDEIQWIASKGSGVLGKIKEAWITWEQLGNIKVIICGSSNKFFTNNVTGQEKILRGLRTRGDIWVPPFTLKEVRDFFLKTNSVQEICLTYMMLGGCPYYLSTLKTSYGFIQAINEAIFLQKTIYLDEIDEILRLEFNNKGIDTVKSILGALTQHGKSATGISAYTGIALTTVNDTVHKLLEYKLIEKVLPINGKSKNTSAGCRYVMRDFFLNFYFDILMRLENRIKANEKGLIFPACCIKSKNGFYIENFSGKAFENLVYYVLNDRSNMKPKIFKKLLLNDVDYVVGTYWDEEMQIDLIVENKTDRVTRVIECKWVTGTDFSVATACKKLIHKRYQPRSGHIVKHVLVISTPITNQMQQTAKKYDVWLVGLEDLM